MKQQLVRSWKFAGHVEGVNQVETINIQTAWPSPILNQLAWDFESHLKVTKTSKMDLGDAKKIPKGLDSKRNQFKGSELEF